MCVYLSFVKHLQVKSLDLVELEPQGCQCVLFLVCVLLQQLHGHLDLLLQTHLELQLTLQLLMSCIANMQRVNFSLICIKNTSLAKFLFTRGQITFSSLCLTLPKKQHRASE